MASTQLAPSDIAHSLRGVFPDQPNVDVKLAEINWDDHPTVSGSARAPEPQTTGTVA